MSKVAVLDENNVVVNIIMADAEADSVLGHFLVQLDPNSLVTRGNVYNQTTGEFELSPEQIAKVEADEATAWEEAEIEALGLK